MIEERTQNVIQYFLMGEKHGKWQASEMEPRNERKNVRNQRPNEWLSKS